ncbi:MAG TPA: methyltransferase [Thermoanaerobaculia bacterium]|nr:methyltransferase [Thermoanaerobaculia bacterium]
MTTQYRGWTRPGPIPPGGIDPENDETLEYLSGNFKIFQYRSGHRYSTDDVLTAWYGTICAPRVERAADLGSGIGSVAMIAAWRLPGARFVTVEAQDISVHLAQKSVRYNGLESRFTIKHGDLRDPSMFDGEAPFDLVLGSPPYFPKGTSVEAQHPQAVSARIEMRGSIADYETTAARILAPGGVFAFVAPFSTALKNLRLVRKRDVIFKEGEPPIIALFAASRREDIPPTYEPFIEPPLTIRRRDGSIDAEYSAIRMSFGFPPGERLHVSAQ